MMACNLRSPLSFIRFHKFSIAREKSKYTKHIKFIFFFKKVQNDVNDSMFNNQLSGIGANFINNIFSKQNSAILVLFSRLFSLIDECRNELEAAQLLIYFICIDQVLIDGDELEADELIAAGDQQIVHRLHNSF